MKSGGSSRSSSFSQKEKENPYFFLKPTNYIRYYPPLPDPKLANKLIMTKTGIYSISKPDISNALIQFIKNNITDFDSIVEASAGLGGDTLALSKLFTEVTAFEKNKIHFKALQNNMKIYNRDNIKYINKSICDLDTENIKKQVIFLDPPWGGPDYAKKEKLTLTYDDKPLKSIYKDFKHVFLKLPFNYDLSEFSSYKIEKFINLKGTVILFIYLSNL
jgi:hypothetical protein